MEGCTDPSVSERTRIDSSLNISTHRYVQMSLSLSPQSPPFEDCVPNSTPATPWNKCPWSCRVSDCWCKLRRITGIRQNHPRCCREIRRDMGPLSFEGCTLNIAPCHARYFSHVLSEFLPRTEFGLGGANSEALDVCRGYGALVRIRGGTGAN